MSIADSAEYQQEQLQRAITRLRGMINRVSGQFEPGNAYVKGYKDALRDVAEDMGVTS